MLTDKQLSRKRGFKTMKRRNVRKFLKAMKDYPRQMALRDQYIATLQHTIESHRQVNAALTKRVDELETLYGIKPATPGSRLWLPGK